LRLKDIGFAAYVLRICSSRFLGAAHENYSSPLWSDEMGKKYGPDNPERGQMVSYATHAEFWETVKRDAQFVMKEMEGMLRMLSGEEYVGGEHRNHALKVIGALESAQVVLGELHWMATNDGLLQTAMAAMDQFFRRYAPCQDVTASKDDADGSKKKYFSMEYWDAGAKTKFAEATAVFGSGCSNDDNDANNNIEKFDVQTRMLLTSYVATSLALAEKMAMVVYNFSQLPTTNMWAAEYWLFRQSEKARLFVVSREAAAIPHECLLMLLHHLHANIVNAALGARDGEGDIF